MNGGKAMNLAIIGLLSLSLIARAVEASASSTCSATMTELSATFVPQALAVGDASNNYDNNLNCWWTICAYGGASVQIDFSRFNTEPGFDKVWLYDHSQTDNSNAVMIDAHSGSVVPSSISSQSSCVVINFETDISQTYSGWALTYRQVPSPTFDCSAYPHQLTAPGSGLTYVATPQAPVYQSPLALRALNYGPNLDCTWRICASAYTTKVVRLSFSQFYTENCCDHVYVYDGNSSLGNQLLYASGSSLPNDVYSSGNCLTVNFQSDSSVQYTGFSALYQLSDPPASSSNVATIVIGVLVPVVIIVAIVACCVSRRRRRMLLSQSSYQPMNNPQPYPQQGAYVQPMQYPQQASYAQPQSPYGQQQQYVPAYVPAPAGPAGLPPAMTPQGPADYRPYGEPAAEAVPPPPAYERFDPNAAAAYAAPGK